MLRHSAGVPHLHVNRLLLTLTLFARYAIISFLNLMISVVETFRFEDEDDYEDEI